LRSFAARLESRSIAADAKAAARGEADIVDGGFAGPVEPAVLATKVALRFASKTSSAAENPNAGFPEDVSVRPDSGSFSLRGVKVTA
jgi:hypothetical protein